MQLTLNIGLRTNVGIDLNSRQVIDTLALIGQPTEWSVTPTQGEVEGTFIAFYELPNDAAEGLRGKIHQVATDLQQDCIAAWFYGPAFADGELIGPKADAWGDFDPEQFTMVDGHKLAEHLARFNKQTAEAEAAARR